MAYIELEDAKAHLRVDYDDDDTYITGLIDMVEATVAMEIEDDLANLEDAEGKLPLRLYQGMLLLLGHFYMLREPVIVGVSVNKIPYGFEFLISPFKNWTIQ